MLNGIWLALMLSAVLFGAFTGRMEAVKGAALAGAKDAVDLVIGLVGVMALFLGLMRVAQEGGLLAAVQRGLAPILRRLFPDVPPDHPAMGAMIMNLASNVLGLGNAATPFGLKAMTELAKLNRTPGSASDAMVLFIAINATSVALFPLGVISIRASLGSASPEAIWAPTLLATSASTATAVALCFALRRLSLFRPRAGRQASPTVPAAAVADDAPPPQPASPPAPAGPLAAAVVWGTVVLLAVALGRALWVGTRSAPLASVGRDIVGAWFLPVFMVALLLIGVAGRVRVYEAAVGGAREALDVAVQIVPFLVLILVAISMLRASGALDALVGVIDPVTSRLGFPAEALPMALLRPLSGSGAYGVMVEIMKTHGPDSFVGILVGALSGSTETTFYVLTIYLGAAGVRDVRHALAACLGGDLAGFAVATAACHWLFR